MGGEIGDVGTISLNGEEFDCIDTIKLPNGQAGRVIDMQDVLLSVGDVVYAKVAGRFFTHKVSAKNDDRGVQISNNHGHVNGWTKHVYGKVIKVLEDGEEWIEEIETKD